MSAQCANYMLDVPHRLPENALCSLRVTLKYCTYSRYVSRQVAHGHAFCYLFTSCSARGSSGHVPLGGTGAQLPRHEL